MGDGKEVNLFNHFFITDEPDVEKRRKKKSSNGDDQNRENSGENSSKNLEKEQERYDDTEDRLKAEREYWENHRVICINL